MRRPVDSLAEDIAERVVRKLLRAGIRVTLDGTGVPSRKGDDECSDGEKGSTAPTSTTEGTELSWSEKEALELLGRIPASGKRSR